MQNGRKLHPLDEIAWAKIDMTYLQLEELGHANDRAAAEQARADQLEAELRYKQVIEKYNRAHGQNRKITLKAICEREGVSYDAVRQFRSRDRKRKKAK